LARTASPAANTKAKASAAPTNRTFHASGRLAHLDLILILKPTVTSRKNLHALLATVNALPMRCKRRDLSPIAGSVERSRSRRGEHRVGDLLGGHQGREVGGSGKIVYTAGQLARDVDGNCDMRAQMEQTFQNLDRCLKAAGATWADVVKTNTFVTDFDEFQKCADVRMRYLGVATPTSTTVGVTPLAGPDFMIEIEAVVVVNSCERRSGPPPVRRLGKPDP
jgi:2-iminobutanoate/2-iminopropanoate deaminase